MVQFPSTQWSLVRSDGSPEARRGAFEQLTRRYRPAIVAYYRSWLDPDAAEDAAQAFLADSYEHAWWSRADADRGSFRTFLRLLLRRHRPPPSHALPVAADLDALEDPAPTAERQFDLRFAMLLTTEALAAQREHYVARGRGEVFEHLKRLLTTTLEHGDLKRVAAELGMPANTLSVELQRLRQRLRAGLREQVVQLCADEASVAAEWDALQRILAGD